MSIETNPPAAEMPAELASAACETPTPSGCVAPEPPYPVQASEAPPPEQALPAEVLPGDNEIELAPAAMPEPANDAELTPELTNDDGLSPESETVADQPQDSALATAEMVQALDAKLDSFLKANAAFSREAFAALKSELSTYKDEFVHQQERTVLNDLIALHDSMRYTVAYFRADGNATMVDVDQLKDRLLENIEGFMTQVEEILRRKDIEVFGTLEKLDIQWQRAVESKPCEDPCDDRRVLSVRKPGYARLGKPFRKEEVVIFRYQPVTNNQQPES